MLKFFQEWKNKKTQRKILVEFYQELKKNLESYYVMDQLGRFRFFRLDSWPQAKDYPGIGKDPLILAYSQRLCEYNAVLDDFTKYEQWYSDLNNKTPANGRILHDKKEEVRNKFQGLEAVIKSALQNFENNCTKKT